MKYRTIYNQIAVYASNISTGSFFLHSNTGNVVYNLISPLDRIFDAKYSFNEPRTNVSSFGDYGTISRPNLVISPTVSLQLSYYQMGLYNEACLGFYFNSSSNNNPLNPPIYGTGNVIPISGFLDRTQYTLDSKNIFVATSDNYNDFNFINPLILGDKTNVIPNNIHIYAFGDCFLNSYKVSAHIGEFPQANLDFVGHNLMYYSGGSGLNSPSVNPLNRTLYNYPFNLPGINSGKSPTVLRPGDITMNISEVGGNNNVLSNLPFDFTDIKIQGYNIDLSLNREPLYNLGYQLPIDRRINLPVFVNLDFNWIAGSNETGSFVDFVTYDKQYNIGINMKYSNNQPLSGTAIYYQFNGAKFNSINITDSISDKRMATMSLSVEIKPNDSGNGFFMSGQLGEPNINNPFITGFWPPSTPLNLVAVAGARGIIDLSWNLSTGFNVSYLVYRNLSSFDAAPPYYIGSTNALNYIDSNLTDSTTYYYRVVATNYGINSNESNLASATTISVPPSAPFLSASGISYSGIGLSWTAANSDFPIYYNLYSGLTSVIVASSANKITGNYSSLFYNTTGMNTNQTYYFEVIAFDTLGQSGVSNITGVSTLVPPAPTSPFLTATVINSGEIDLSWTSSSSILSIYYQVFSGNTIGFVQNASSKIKDNLNVLFYHNTGLTTGQEFFYYVGAIDTLNRTGMSNEASGYTYPPPSSFTLLAGGAGTGEIDLSWTASNSLLPLYYNLYSGSIVSFTPDNNHILTTGLQTLSYSMVGVPNNSEYYFYGKAIDTLKQTGISNEASGQTSQITWLIPVMTDDVTPSGTASDSVGDNIAYYGFQIGNTNPVGGGQNWTNGNYPATTGLWLEYDFPSPIVPTITSYMIFSDNTPGTGWYLLQGYNTSFSSWINIDSQQFSSYIVGSDTLIVNLSSPVTYPKFRMTVTGWCPLYPQGGGINIGFQLSGWY